MSALATRVIQYQVEACPIFSGHWVPYFFFQTSLDIIGYSRWPDFSGHVRRPAHFGHFRSHLATCTWWQINSKIVAIDECRSAIASILELLSILVCFIYQIIPLQSLLWTCDAIFDSQNIAGSASDRRHLGSESGMTNWLWLKVAAQKCSESYFLILWYLIHNIFI